MKKLILLLILFCGVSLLSFSQLGTQDSAGKQAKDSADMKSPPIDRDMFGWHIPRGLTITSDGLADGYILFAVPNSALVYLINRKGEVVHQWKGNYGNMTCVAYLQDDGSIIANAVDPDFPVFASGGEAGRIEKITWDGKTVWDFEYASEQYLHHHDFTVMPNGHILLIAWEAKTADEAIAAGRKPALVPKAGVWPDKIVEIEPLDNTHGKVVWEWHSFDHLIQGFDKTKKNYGTVADHPELLNFNLGEPLPPPISQDSMDILKNSGKIPWKNQTPDNMGSDIFHFNAVKYNPDLDQIVFSSPEVGEIFIIDHSTTTQEAVGHKGGKYGKGGDFLYRWGNPQNYHHGDSTDQQLYYQHDVRWVEKGCPGEGHLTIYNDDIPNKNAMNYSAIYEIVPPVDGKGNYIMNKDKTFGPDKPVWKYIAPDTVSFWSRFISGAQRMSNGNTFIDEGGRGRFFEVTNDGKIVWEYLNPYRGDVRKLNGDSIPAMPMVYIIFRSNFIPADHPGLAGKKLDPIEPQPKQFVLPSPVSASIMDK